MAACAGDEYVVNLTATLLKFCGLWAPLRRRAAARLGRSTLPTTAAAANPNPIWGATRRTHKIAGRVVAASSSAAASSSSDAAAASESLFEELENDPPPAAPAGSASGGASLSFVGEAFFLTQYAFHVGFVPALRQWRRWGCSATR